MASARRALLALLFALTATSALAQTTGAGGETVVGDIRVRGAGVIAVANQWFHLLGATTFERDETCKRNGLEYQCGLIGQGVLADIAHETQYSCTLKEFPGDTRRWGTCVPYDFGLRRPIPGGVDLATAWVRSGWAFANTLHGDALLDEEAQAKAAKKGMWEGTTPPLRSTDVPKQAFGPAWVFDGNSMRVGGTLVFLAGIDAPELPQSCSLGAGQGGYFCGAYVRSVLIKLTMGKKIFCAIERRQGDDRNWATCAEANAAGTGPKDGAKSINEEMVRSGWAVADRRTSNAYLNAQIDADNENVGLWQGTFTTPREWRLGFR